jgi:hypothetical protein
MTRPVLGLLARRAAPAPFVRLAADLQAYATVRAADPGDPSVSAWLVLAPEPVPGGGRPGARWDGDPAHAVELTDGSTQLVIDGIDVRLRRPTAPFIRARWRERFGLPSPFIVEVAVGAARLDGGSQLPEWLEDAALGLASVAVALDEPSAVEAMATAAPTVVTGAIARSLGPAAGDAAVIGGWDEARSLSLDERASAALSRAGRRFVEAHRDGGMVTLGVARSLGLVAERLGTGGPIDVVLDELWTPLDAAIRDRAASAMAEREGATA